MVIDMIELIKEQFMNLNTLEWISQICGIIGFILYLISTQLSRKKFLYISLVFFVFFMLEQVLAGLYGGIITNVTSFTRSIILLIYLKNNKEIMPSFINYILIAITWIVETLLYIFIPNSFANIFNCYIPIVLCTVFALTQNKKSFIVQKIGILINEVGFFIYFLVNNLPFSYLRELILITSILISICREVFKNKKEA